MSNHKTIQIIDARTAMALFKLREEYLETRIMDFDPNNSEEAQKRSRQKVKLIGKENVGGGSQFVLADSDAAMLVLKQMCYHEIRDKQKFSIRPS